MSTFGENTSMQLTDLTFYYRNYYCPFENYTLNLFDIDEYLPSRK